jgi:hypothetical protein
MARRLGVAIVLFALVFTSACRSGEDRVPDETTSPTGAPAPSSDPLDPGTVEERLRDARFRLGRGEFEAAISVIEELRVAGVPSDVEAQLATLYLRASQGLVPTKVLRSGIVLDSSRVALGTPITGQILLSNVGTLPLSVPNEANGRLTTIQLELSYQEFDVGGTVITERRQMPVIIGRDVLLAAGETFGLPVVLDSSMFGESANYRVFVIGALLYPAKLMVGEEDFTRNLQLDPATCAVFPRNYEHLAFDPLGRLDEAVSKDSPVHVCLAAALVREEDKRRAIAALLEHMERPSHVSPDGPTRLACCVALRILTGEDIPARPERWIAWARTR